MITAVKYFLPLTFADSRETRLNSEVQDGTHSPWVRNPYSLNGIERDVTAVFVVDPNHFGQTCYDTSKVINAIHI